MIMRKFKLFTIAAAVLMMAACSNDDRSLQPQAKPGQTQFTATIAAPNSCSTRTTYSESGDVISVTWNVGDEIALVHDGVKDIVKVETVNGDGSATIKGNLTGATNGAKVVLAYPADAISASNDDPGYNLNADIVLKLYAQDGTLKYIQDNLDYRKDETLTLTVTESGATLSGEADMTVDFSIFKFTLQDDDTAALAVNKFTLKQNVFPLVGTVELATTSSTFYLAVPSLNVASKITFEATIGEDTYTYEKEDVTIAPSKYYQCTLTMTKTAGTY
jgi:hypothetical protein